VRDSTPLRDGVARVVLGSVAVGEPAVASRIIAGSPGKVAVGLDHREGEVRARGWEEGTGVHVLDALTWPEFAGAAAFIITNIGRDATLEGPDFDGLGKAVAAAGDLGVPVIASGGVGGLDDLRRLRDTGVSGVIVGKAIYEGRFTVEEAVSACAP
jgi:phosphoribosylformimino-5-aminoimidazole carboxamide ribotide isomerase